MAFSKYQSFLIFYCVQKISLVGFYTIKYFRKSLLILCNVHAIQIFPSVVLRKLSVGQNLERTRKLWFELNVSGIHSGSVPDNGLS